jgi:hypothetical protein
MLIGFRSRWTISQVCRPEGGGDLAAEGERLGERQPALLELSSRVSPLTSSMVRK